MTVYPVDTTLQSHYIVQGSGFNFYDTTLTTAGTYYHTLISSRDCDSIITVNLAVSQPSMITASKDTTIIAGSYAQLYATGGVNYQWSPSTYLNSSNISNPVSTPLNSISYIVTITDTNGCSVKDTVNITVESPDIWLPNVFDPNNSDPLNQTFHISGKGIKDLVSVVYNRWGEKVFESNDVNRGWDGTFKGEKLPKGVFVYYVKATFYDGKEIERKGDVSLIR